MSRSNMLFRSPVSLGPQLRALCGLMVAASLVAPGLVRAECESGISAVGPYLGACITYSVANLPTQDGATEADVDLAFAEWNQRSELSGLGFTKVTSEGNFDVEGAPTPSAVPPGTLARAVPVQLSGMVVGGAIWISNDWTWGTDPGVTNLAGIMVHELGHFFIGSGHYGPCSDCLDLGFDEVPSMATLGEGSPPCSEGDGGFAFTAGPNPAIFTLATLDLNLVVGVSLVGEPTLCFNADDAVYDLTVNGDQVSWTLADIGRLDTIRVQARTGTSGPWADLTSVTLDVEREYTVWAPLQAYDEVQLTGNSIDGVTVALARTSIDTVAFDPTFGGPAAGQLRTQGVQTAQATAASPDAWSGDPVTTVLCFTPDTYVSYIQPLADYWAARRGVQVVFEALSGYPSAPAARRSAIAQKIRTEALSGVQDLRVHLVGDASDYVQVHPERSLWHPSINGWTIWVNSYDWVLEAHNIIPTFYTADPRGRNDGFAGKRPYFYSDLPYADIDDDGLPEVVLARWPVHNEQQVANLVAKVLERDELGRAAAPTDVLVSGMDNGNPSVIPQYGGEQFVRDQVTALVSSVATPYTVVSSLSSSQTELSDWQDSVLQSLVTRPVALAAMHGTLSSAANPAYTLPCIERTWDGNANICYSYESSTTSMGQADMVVAASCHAGGFATSYYGRFDEFLHGRSSGGSIAWTGPALGSMELANVAVSSALVDAMTTEKDRSLAAVWRDEFRTLLSQYPAGSDVGSTIRSYSFLGDPISALRPLQKPGKVDPDPPEWTMEASPNPFNPSTTIRFNLAKSTDVVLSIYNAAGRVVRTVSLRGQSAGPGQFEWRGEDNQGRAVGSGVYFVDLTAGAFRAQERVVLLK